MRYSALMVLVVALIGFLACEEERLQPDEVDRGFDYYPLVIGQQWTYAVDSIIYDFDQSGTVIDSIRSYMKLEVVDSSENGYVVDQYWRPDPNEVWQLHSVLNMSTDEEGAYLTEDNLRFVKLQWPLSVLQSWSGHRFFDDQLNFSVAGEVIQLFKNWDYRVLNADTSLVLGDQMFDEVIKVREADDKNFIEYRKAESFYAKNIGLVYKEWQLLDTQCEVCCNLDFVLCDTLSWRQKAEVGFILRMQLIDYE